MTIGEAHAANEIADELIVLARNGVTITTAIEHGVGVVLINSNKALMAGWTPATFFAAIAKARKEVA